MKNNKKVQWTFLCSSPKTGKREGASGPFYVRARKQESEKVPVDLFMFEPENRKARRCQWTFLCSSLKTGKLRKISKIILTI
ncbi:hypothetical protein HMPREF9352_1542 [Streptococcus gallolyticus subsp. gallolyticus TX20005]|nr:hypothetical protein HMPREF9352_1542 [Streptococcus gallolyticus subsp. gallolyticus TX20005]